MKTSCREYTLPRHEENTIGQVLDVKVCYQGRYGVEIMIESLFRD